MSKTSAEQSVHPIRLLVLAGLGGLALLASAMLAAPVTPEPGKPFEKELLRVAKDYKAWGRVDDEMRWAPFLCRMPEPGKPQFSASKDADTHGQKLYSLFAKDRNAYLQLGEKKAAAVGQVVVKESWVPEEVTDRKAADLGPKDVITGGPGSLVAGDHFFPYLGKGGKLFKASKLAGLFVMLKLDPKTEGTDTGWVYGTIGADLKTVTAAGKVETCMKCHESAKYDRLFWFAQK
jgi:hypothetical protein